MTPSLSSNKRWHKGAEIVYQKEILVTDERSDDDYTNNTETSFSLQNTPDVTNLSERRTAKGKKNSMTFKRLAD